MNLAIGDTVHFKDWMGSQGTGTVLKIEGMRVRIEYKLLGFTKTKWITKTEITTEAEAASGGGGASRRASWGVADAKKEPAKSPAKSWRKSQILGGSPAPAPPPEGAAAAEEEPATSPTPPPAPKNDEVAPVAPSPVVVSPPRLPGPLLPCTSCTLGRPPSSMPLRSSSCMPRRVV